jgi:ATP-dependent HslUV protease ATP-binding subunit HslU
MSALTERAESMTPRQIVEELDRYVVGQAKAKRAVAVALRNRSRRQRLAEEIRDEVSPKNILMIGPTGVGKTEIARRISKQWGAPFIKVEATKYTEVGYVGRDVESMIRDLMASGFAMVKAEMQQEVREKAEAKAESRILDLLLPGIGATPALAGASAGSDAVEGESGGTRERFREMLRSGALDDRMVEIEVAAGQGPAIEIMSGGQMEDMEIALNGIAGMFGQRKKRRTLRVAEAMKILAAEETERLTDRDRVAEEARRRVEQMGIVFVDEIDKIANRDKSSGSVDVSREGVQRDILPIVEGCTVNTKYGVVDTTHILFIAAGAFNVSKPTDLIPELQGRFPIRVELEPLTASDFERILTEPKNALTAQYSSLLGTEGLELRFAPEAIRKIASIAETVNARTENIGARRLHTVMERLLEDLSFEASERSGESVLIDDAFVEERFKDVFERQDLSNYIL